MTLTSRGRVAIAALIVALAFAAAFVVRKASAGSTPAARMPTPFVLSRTPADVRGLTLPGAPPPLHQAPHRSAPTPSSTSTVTPTETTAPTPTPKSSTPPAGGGGSGGGSKGGGPVIVG